MLAVFGRFGYPQGHDVRKWPVTPVWSLTLHKKCKENIKTMRGDDVRKLLVGDVKASMVEI